MHRAVAHDCPRSDDLAVLDHGPGPQHDAALGVRTWPKHSLVLRDSPGPVRLLGRLPRSAIKGGIANVCTLTTYPLQQLAELRRRATTAN